MYKSIRNVILLHFIALTIILSGKTVFAQTGCPEIFFYNQSQVDNFPKNYPGCSRINGSVNFYSEDILALDSLYPIQIIEGDLIMDGYNNFNGLHNVDSIYGSLVIEPDYGVVTVFDSLKFIGGNFYMIWSDATALPGFPALTNVIGDLNIYANQFLQDMSGLSNLTTVRERLMIYYNMQLTSLTGLENLQSNSIKEIFIYNNPLLSSCNEPFICEILGNPLIPVNIYQNAPECNNPAIIANACGVTLNSLPFGNYYVTTQEEAEDFANLYPECDTLNGNLTITGDDILNLPGLIGIKRINGYFSSGPTQNLINFSGLDSLKVITGGMQIGWWEGSYNSALQNFTGLDNLTSVGRVEIINNQSLQNFQGLGNLRKMTMVDIVYNDNLTSLNGLNKLDTINDYLHIAGNPVLADLSALINLKRINGWLEIGHNDLLTSLHGLDSAKMDNLSITYNAMLSECAVKSICDYLSIPGSRVNIDQNAAGCNTREEVEADCLVGLSDIRGYENLLIYPNPVNDFFKIDIFENHLNYQLTVYNSSGQALIEKLISSDDQWVNVAKLPKGIYLVKLVFPNSDVVYGKLVK